MTDVEIRIGARTVKLPGLKPDGLPGSFVDQETKELLIIMCRKDDTATEIFVSKHGLLIGNNLPLRKVTARHLVRVARVQRGVAYERRIMTPLGWGWLSVRHR